MKKLSLLSIALIAAVSIYALQGPELSVSVSDLSVKQTAPKEYTVTIAISQQGIFPDLFEGVRVTVPHVHYHATGYIENNCINETDFTYAGLNYDLNGDGDTADSYELSLVRRVYYLGKVPLKIITAPHQFNDMTVLNYTGKDREPRTNRLSETARPFIVYSVSKKDMTITTGLGTQEKPVTFIETDNPCIMVELLCPVKNTRKDPACSIAGITQYTSFTNEKIFKGYGDSWTASVWGFIPLKAVSQGQSSHRISVRGVEKPFGVRASVLLSMEKGVVVQSRPSIVIKE